MYKKMRVIAMITIVGLMTGMVSAEPLVITDVAAELLTPPDEIRGDSYGPRILLKFELPDSLDFTETAFASIGSRILLPTSDNPARVINFYAFPVTTEWSQYHTTWYFPWSEPGGDYDTSLREFFAAVEGQQDKFELDITEFIREWTDGTRDNYGLIIVPRRVDGTAYHDYTHIGGIFTSGFEAKIIR